MRICQVEDAWSMENVRINTRPEPQPGAGQVRLRMKASAINYRDLLVPLRGYGSRMKALPLIMLSDGIGTVESVGEGVKNLKIGDRVCPLFFQTWISGEPNKKRLSLSLGCELDGTMADLMVLPEEGVALAPGHLDDMEAVSLPTAAVTAWRALATEGCVMPGDKVLVQGTGGVSLFALQFAKMLGAFVIVTSSSDEKLARVRRMGADETINYRMVPEWGKRAREIAGSDGVDHVVEVGGQGTLPQSLRAVRTGGTISMIGVLAGGNMDVPLGPIVTRHVRLQGITVGNRDDFVKMTRAIEQHMLHPVIDRVFAFEELHVALDYLSSGKHFGKICIMH
ncbi:NAD(P)-dependent alcohol dehydrogenase [Desulfococcus sp.]|uniref:zinc-dependent alcohol dehydrogenase family protein n=1 Tax=Desulfococcus sp. TaxID=2025834 RepID=UPI0035947A35